MSHTNFSTIAVFPTPGSPTKIAFLFVALAKILTSDCVSFWRPKILQYFSSGEYLLFITVKKLARALGNTMSEL